MKVLIINTTIDETKSSRILTSIDNAITMNLYLMSRNNKSGQWNDSLNRLTANHIWSKYTFIDEKAAYIGTFKSMNEVLVKHTFLGNVLILTHEQWLDKTNPNWRNELRSW
jgi:hypothetical protein